MDQNHGNSARTTSMPSLIAWLSLCLLAASFGRSLDARWQVLWAEMGAFGLAAAVGLGSLERARHARQQRAREQAMQARFECGLTRLNQHSATIDAINAAVRTLVRQATIDKCGRFGGAHHNRRRDQLKMLANYALQIVPVDEQAEIDAKLPPIDGVLQQISSRVVSFKHTESIPTRTVLLTFQIGESQLSFVVDVTWTQKIDDAYSSGGTVVAVGVPSSEAEPVAAGC